MRIAEKIFSEVSKMPDHLAQEVLDFVEYIQRKYDVRDKEIQNLKEAQASVMNSTWDNEEDDIWNEHPSC